MQNSQLGSTGLMVSRLGMGTAEIGFDYGIGARPLPPEEVGIALLREAWKLDINFFDTANYYGLAEERIGKSGISHHPQAILETKCAQFLEKGEYFSRDELESKIRSQVSDSLVKLQVSSLTILMLHGPNQEQINRGELIAIMKSLQKEGLVRFLGVSTRGEEPAIAAIQSEAFDVIQVAYNILDQRMTTHVLPMAHKAKIAVVSRSTLLKGALTTLRDKLPPILEPLKKQVDKIEAIANSLGLDLPTLAIRFAISNPLIATSLIGTNKLENLGRAVAATETGPLPKNIISQLEELAIADPQQIDPAKWPSLS